MAGRPGHGERGGWRLPEERNPRSTRDYIEEAIERLEHAEYALGEGDIPLVQDRLDEAYASVIAARNATGPDHHAR